jgi:pilus assembly protein CpaE
MIKLAGKTPVIVLTEAFDDAVGRWFLQIRVSDFLRKPIRMDDLMRACVKALRDAHPETETRARVLSFTPASGGVGATTLAIEAAMQVLQSGASAGETVCLVDLDFSGNACSDALDIEPRLDIAELGDEGERLDSQLLEVMLARHSSGLNLLSARGRPGEPSGLSPPIVGRLLDVAASRFDHIVIDLPRAWMPFTDDVLAGSDRIFVVTDMTVPGLRGARRLAERIRERGIATTTPGVIVNRFQTGLLFGSGLRRADVERALGPAFAGPVSNNYPLVREAIDRGISLEAVKPGNNVTGDLKRILFAAQAAQ